MAELRLERVSKRYSGRREVVALEPVDLTIRDGEFMTILGPSGCGKTTLLNIIAGLIPPTSGTVWLGDREITVLDPKDRDMAMVFQNYALYPSKTARGNLEFPLRMRGVPRDARARLVEETAAVLGLGELLDRFPRQLSGGQQQRVALGRALIRRPRVFLMDEPLSNLDAKLRMQMRSEIKRLHRQFPITTVYVTHDQAEAMALSDRVAVMNHGVVVQVGTPAEVYHRPADVFVAGFVGTVAMNLLRVSVRARDSVVECVLPNGLLVASLPGRDGRAGAGEATLGVRPQHVRWAPRRGDDGGAWLDGIVEETDVVGDDTYLHVRIAGGPGVMLLDRTGEGAVPGQHVAVAFERSAVHLFDGETGRAVPGASAEASRA
jgi:multiple sugar transport system ATP-binding protein